ncbi:MAG: SRPBCC domain-containing protein [Pseudolabrys sp.]
MTAVAKTAPYGEASVTLTRVFDAPRTLVWKAWTDPKMMARWFGPRGFTNPSASSTCE